MCVRLYYEANIYILFPVKTQNTKSLCTPESTYAEWNLSKKLHWWRGEASAFGEQLKKAHSNLTKTGN